MATRPEENWPPIEAGFSQGFFSPFSHLMEFWFLALAFGLLSWGHLIFNSIIDLCCCIIFMLSLWSCFDTKSAI